MRGTVMYAAGDVRTRSRGCGADAAAREPRAGRHRLPASEARRATTRRRRSSRATAQTQAMAELCESVAWPLRLQAPATCATCNRRFESVRGPLGLACRSILRRL